MFDREDLIFNREFTYLHRLVCGFSKGNVADEIREHPELINTVDTYGYTPLFWAVISQNDDAAQLLLENGADLTVTNHFGETLFHWDSLSIQDDTKQCIVKALMGPRYSQSQRWKTVNQQSYRGMTPWKVAIMDGNATFVKAFLEIGCDFSLVDNCGVTLIHETMVCLSNEVINMVAAANLSKAPLREKANCGCTAIDFLKQRISISPFFESGEDEPIDFEKSQKHDFEEAQALINLLKQAAKYDPSIWKDLKTEFSRVEEIADLLVAHWPKEDDNTRRGSGDSSAETSQVQEISDDATGDGTGEI